MANAKTGYKTRLAYEDTPGSGTFTEITRQTSLTPGDPQYDEIETTDQDSLNSTKEFVQTMKDPGMVSVGGNRIAGDTTQDRLRTLRDARSIINWRINFRDPESGAILETCTFQGWVKSYSPDEISPQAAQKYKATIRCTGSETWA